MHVSAALGTAYVLWGAFFAGWILTGVFSSKTTVRSEGQSLYTWLNVLSFACLFVVPGAKWSPWSSRLWVLPDWAEWGLVGITVLGFAFCIWARLHLGALWSASVTRKEGHRIVDTGPYGLVRHPIYTGILLSAFATAILAGAAVNIAGAVLKVVAFFIKARLEERFLMGELGTGAYAGYQLRTPMLVPFWPRSLKRE